ncbi:uncharacterized protein LOC143721963 [Siphateles boraxobius]|uniref:uncharacterized protein LOC143721963 n=1 Tax=Siphateles boraxobius TaxID=180520 RepID=UPI0040636E34
MRASLFLWILLEQTLAFQDLNYIQRLEGESVDMSCVTQASKSHPSLYLRRRFGHSESVLNISEDEGVRADPGIEGRIKISGQTKFLQTGEINVTLSDLRRTDTGLYVCDFSGNPPDQHSVNTAFFLLVNAAGKQCSCRMYSLLIYTISVGVSLLLLTVIALFLILKKPNAQQEHLTAVPIYEDMSCVQGSSANHYRICPPEPERSAPGWTKSNRKTMPGKL